MPFHMAYHMQRSWDIAFESTVIAFDSAEMASDSAELAVDTADIAFEIHMLRNTHMLLPSSAKGEWHLEQLTLQGSSCCSVDLSEL